MKIRLVSDLHLDINDDYDVTLNVNGENDVFTLVAGDVCGTVESTIEWMKNNVKRGAFCAGNHIVYNPNKNVKVPIEDLKNKLHEAFPADGDVTFMDYDVGVMQKEICDGVLLVGDVMYTDYKLKIPTINEAGDYKFNMKICAPNSGLGRGYMNDFVYGYTKKRMYKKEKWDDGESRYGTPKGLWCLRPKYYRDHHIKAWREVTRIVESNPDKNIILMTHHCLSPMCISEDYCNDSLNASYVSNKDRWIKRHPNVKLILSGHVHHRNHFKIGNTLYVLNPLGYCRESLITFNPDTNSDEMWTPNCFVDTDTWELTYEPYENEEWRDHVSAYRNHLLKYASFFF